MTPERIAECRQRYAVLERMVARLDASDPEDLRAVLQQACSAAKTVPALLDEIERIQAAADAGEGR